MNNSFWRESTIPWSIPILRSDWDGGESRRRGWLCFILQVRLTIVWLSRAIPSPVVTICTVLGCSLGQMAYTSPCWRVGCFKYYFSVNFAEVRAAKVQFWSQRETDFRCCGLYIGIYLQGKYAETYILRLGVGIFGQGNTRYVCVCDIVHA